VVTKKGRINRNLLAQTQEEGGLKLTHIQSQIDALKIRWIRCLLLEDNDWTNIFQTTTGLDDCDSVLSLDPKSILNIVRKTKSSFWRDVLKSWAKLVEVYKMGEVNKLLQFSLWDSWYIKSNNLKHLRAELTLRGCKIVADLFDDSMNIISYNNFCEQYTHINFLDATLMTSLPAQWKRLLLRETRKPEFVEPVLVQHVLTKPKTCKFAYDCFVKSLPIVKPHEVKWGQKGINITDMEWKIYNALPYKCTKSTKLQAFQYKVIHRVLGTGVFKHMCQIIDDDACTFCAEEAETLLHLFAECPVVKAFWETLWVWLGTYLDLISELNQITIMFGDVDSLMISHVILTAKYYIFLCQIRKQRPCLAGVIPMLKVEYSIEKHIAKRSMNLFKTFQDKWGPVDGLLSEDA
jgi:hypothetical protein